MYSVEEIWEEQERQYNQLMEEDDQYCHPESFRWGFEHGVEYALTKAGWHPASEPPKEDGEYVVFCYGFDLPFKAKYSEYINEWSHRDVKWWCYPPEKWE